MKAVLILALLLSGCARYNIEPPVTSYTKDFEYVEAQDITAPAIPKSPKAKSITVEGITYGAFDAEGMAGLSLMRSRAEQSTEILQEVIAANSQLIAERNRLLEVAASVESRSNVMAKEWALSEEQRRKSEDIRLVERILYPILAIIGIAALL